MAKVWNIDEVLNHPKLSDDFKLKFFEELFETEVTEDNVELLYEEFKKWRANNIKSSNVKKILYNDETQVGIY